jgi:hypothetical protein
MSKILVAATLLFGLSFTANAETFEECSNRCTDEWTECSNKCSPSDIACPSKCTKEHENCQKNCEDNANKSGSLLDKALRDPSV